MVVLNDNKGNNGRMARGTSYNTGKCIWQENQVQWTLIGIDFDSEPYKLPWVSGM